MTTNTTIKPAQTNRALVSASKRVSLLTKRLQEAQEERDSLRNFLIEFKEKETNEINECQQLPALDDYLAHKRKTLKRISKLLNDTLQ